MRKSIRKGAATHGTHPLSRCHPCYDVTIYSDVTFYSYTDVIRSEHPVPTDRHTDMTNVLNSVADPGGCRGGHALPALYK